MLFNSFEYFVFLAVCLLVYWNSNRRVQNVFLLVASYFFYACWDWRFLSLIVVSTIVDYWAGRSISAARQRGDQGVAKRGLLLSLVTNLGILGCFKYFDFFAETAAELLQGLGLSVSPPLLNVVLPVGISFYTFQTLSYSIDIYRGRLEPTRDVLDFALFVAFFPQLVAGPIERARNLLPQLQRERRLTAEDVGDGVWLILVGLFRKVVIADTAATFVDPYFAEPARFGAVELMCGLGLYALQIYGDFSGYSNIARGSSRLLGITLMRNFEHPYFSRSITEFWRRWHISLSSWLRDYLYIPLGGNRRGRARTYLNLMLTMLLGGLWHGASWNFVLWGGLHGAYLAVHRWMGGRGETSHGGKLGIRGLLAMAGTFALASFTWLFFRSTDLVTTMAYLSGLTRFEAVGWQPLVPFAALSALVLAIDLPQAATGDEMFIRRHRVPARVAFASAVLLLMAFSGADIPPFIYFQF